MTATIATLIAGIIQDREIALSTESAADRQDLAIHVVEAAMFMVHKLLGEDLLRAAMGTVDESDRAAVLFATARRLIAMSAVFGTMDDDAAAPFKVAEEAVAVANGDAPVMFARLERRKVNDRINRAKCEALLWDAYLKGKGMKPAERRAKIATAFGHAHGWETIRRGWRRDVANTYKKSTLTYLLLQAEAEGRRGDPRWRLRGDHDWETALNRDGRKFLDIQRENNGNR